MGIPKSSTVEYGVWEQILWKRLACKRWLIFENFLKDVGKKPGDGYRMARSDTSKEYGPGNGRWVKADGLDKYKVERRAWASMKQRCLNSNNPRYMDYGGRGITVCERWMLFKNFLKDMGMRPEGRVLRRLDINKGYEPGNVIWGKREDLVNNRRGVHLVKIGKKTRTVTQWSKEKGINSKLVFRRIQRGMSDREAVMVPFRKYEGTREYNGETKTLQEWADQYAEATGLTRQLLTLRLHRGWSMEKALHQEKQYHTPLDIIDII